MGIALALLASASWGIGDFIAGHRSQRLGALRVAVWSQLFGLVMVAMVVALLARGDVVAVTTGAVFLGACAGSVGALGLVAFYRAMALGPMALIPPIAASGVVLPVTFGIIVDDLREPRAFIGIGLAVVGVVLAALPPGRLDASRELRRMSRATLVIALVSAVGFAGFQILVDIAGADDPSRAVAATLGIRIGGFTTVVVAALALRLRWGTGVDRRHLGALVAIAVCDTLANGSFALAAAVGSFSVAAILASLYPAITSGLAWLVLREQVGRVQLAGALLTLTGVLLLAW